MSRCAHTFILGGWIAMLFAIAGCTETNRSDTDDILAASPPSFDRESERAGDDVNASGRQSQGDRDEGERPTESTRDLIEQARHDVQAWMQISQSRAGDTEGQSDESEEGAPALPVGNRPSDIEWSDPVGTAGRPSSDSDDTSEGSVQREPGDAIDGDVEPSDAEGDEGDAALSSPDRDGAVQRSIDELAAMDDAQISELIVELCSELYREGAYEDQPLRQLLLIAAMSLYDPERQLDADALPGLVERERVLLGALQSMFVELGSNLNDENDPHEVIVRALDGVRDRLVEEPQLYLASAALCTEVSGFGSYTPFDRNVFLAQSSQQAVLYLEVDGFTSEQNDQGQWQTRISQQLEIYRDEDGIPVWREDWQTAVDNARQRRNDFYMVQLITIPSRLGVGAYHLKIRVRDEISRAEAETGIRFELVADERLASPQAAQ